MLLLNSQNVEALILARPEVRRLLPDLAHIFDPYLLAVRTPGLTGMRQRAVLDCLNGLTADHLTVLSNHYRDTATVSRLSYDLVRNVATGLTGGGLEGNEGFGEFCVGRDKDRLYITFWR